mgnify:FL=1
MLRRHLKDRVITLGNVRTTQAVTIPHVNVNRLILVRVVTSRAQVSIRIPVHLASVEVYVRLIQMLQHAPAKQDMQVNNANMVVQILVQVVREILSFDLSISVSPSPHNPYTNQLHT